MKLTHILAATLASGALLFAPATFANNQAAAVDEMEAYLDFVDYGGATIFPEHIPKDEWKKFHVIDARDKDQYAKYNNVRIVQGGLAEWKAKGGFDAAAKASGHVKN